MATLRQAYTAVIARGDRWSGTVATEPYEAAWAGEAIFFVRALAVKGRVVGGRARVQMSPDGMNWVNEGTGFALPRKAGEVTFAKVTNFGGFLRLLVAVPARASLTVVATLALKA